jgi:hypothetical protein
MQKKDFIHDCYGNDYELKPLTEGGGQWPTSLCDFLQPQGKSNHYPLHIILCNAILKMVVKRKLHTDLYLHVLTYT